ncbi:MAG: 50S ribosomal protein L21 [Candidatus Cloacimonadota bacterium]|nr:MAG: 50S ribosomal protein L21 [Candidatus Cloacimonadota bacterium]
MYAIVDFKGHHIRAEKGAKLRVPFLSYLEEGAEVEMTDVVLLNNDSDILVGQPKVAEAKVVAEVVAHRKDKKVIVFKKKRRKGYTKKQGHRQKYTEVLVKDILF